jgi:AP-2 complex subunit beta-1
LLRLFSILKKKTKQMLTYMYSVWQTFIRNATGKALADSPALNAHSRAVLIPLVGPQLPPSLVTVPGAGPNESHAASSQRDAPPPEPEDDADADEHPPPPPVRKPSLIDLEMANRDDGSGDEGDDALSPTGATPTNDPYSNLGALGRYSADEPRPMGTLTARGGRQHDEDLLF